jgi:hypothetical protein
VIASLSVLFVLIVRSLVGALGLDVAGLLALVASSLGGGLRRAVAGKMSDFTAVVALLALGAVAWELLEGLKREEGQDVRDMCP